MLRTATHCEDHAVRVSSLQTIQDDRLRFFLPWLSVWHYSGIAISIYTTAAEFGPPFTVR